MSLLFQLIIDSWVVLWRNDNDPFTSNVLFGSVVPIPCSKKLKEKRKKKEKKQKRHKTA